MSRHNKVETNIKKGVTKRAKGTRTGIMDKRKIKQVMRNKHKNRRKKASRRRKDMKMT